MMGLVVVVVVVVVEIVVSEESGPCHNQVKHKSIICLCPSVSHHHYPSPLPSGSHLLRR